MTYFKRIAAVFAVMAALLLAVPASAEATPSSCPNSTLCGYVDINYWCSTQGCELNPTRSGGTCENVTFRNAWSSLWNNSGRSIRVYKNLNCGGDSLFYYNGTGDDHMSIDHFSFENNIESYRFL